ncbi:MAG: signal peptidase I [Phycisphaerales bacterium]|nr:signal peptidase I [Phycisphaerales bacterium]
MWKSFKGWVWAFALAFAILGPIRSSAVDWNDVPTGSMEPTILPGDRIFVNKMAYGLRLPFTKVWLAEWGEPRPGDIVTFFSPKGGTRLVKRIVAGPGDKVELRDNHLYVNGSPLQYGPAPSGVDAAPVDPKYGEQAVMTEYLAGRAHAVTVTPRVPSIRTFAEVVVPPGQYFMMGDNRDVSQDSRFIGCVPRGLITGRSGMVALSVDPRRYYLPRLERFFRSMH